MFSKSSYISRRTSGFTLIELLVVLMVMSLVLSLVGPAIQKVYAQHMAQQEMRLLSQYVRNASAFAYAQNNVVSLQAQGNRIVARLVPSPGKLTQEDEGEEKSLAFSLNDDLFLDNSPTFSQQENDDGFDNSVSSRNTLFEHQFNYLTLMPAAFEALPSGYLTLDSLQVSLGSGEITKDVALKGLRFTEWFQG